MRLLLRAGNLFVLLTYFLLSLVPFAPFLFFGQVVKNPFPIVGMEIVAWITVWVIFKRPAWFHIFLLPAFLALPVELYLRAFYGQGISTQHLAIIAETSPKEAAEFLGGKIWVLAAVVVVVIAWWLLSWVAAWRTRDLDWTSQSRKIIFLLLAVGFLPWIYDQQIGVRLIRPPTLDPALATGTTPTLHKLPPWARVPFEMEQFGNTWPFGLIATAYDYGRARQYLANFARNNHSFVFNAHQSAATAEMPQIVVMVIGESSRADRWSLNGYARETNPLLKNEPNIVSLSNIITPISATRVSVPVIVSRKSARDSLEFTFPEKSFISAYKEAGFKTYWLSNQMSYGQNDTPVSVFAQEADVVQFMNLGAFTDSASFDQILLDPLKRAIADPARKKLIVLHSLGSHWNYSRRYPGTFDKWQPSLFGVTIPSYPGSGLKLKFPLNNSYDNSIRYTDWFLSNVINTLKQSQQLASMMYVSDHGELLYDGTCNLALHGHNTQYEFHIPAIVWYSNLYETAYADKVIQLKKNKDARLSTENVFQTLLDMADIRYPTEQLEWSFLSKKLQEHTRYVYSNGWADYDNSTFKGDCREVVDNVRHS